MCMCVQLLQHDRITIQYLQNCKRHMHTEPTEIQLFVLHQILNFKYNDVTMHSILQNHTSTTHGTYKRDVQLVRACMHDPMNIQGKHTGCSWCAYSECCATLVQRRLPTCFSGRYRWKSLALVQRPVAFPASY